jgi:uncharacterized YigZ family protein
MAPEESIMDKPSSYKRIITPGFGEYEEKKSRFLSEAVSVSSETEVREYLAGVKKKYYDARHHCSAYCLGDDGGLVRSSDDGEPSGTAGKPILEVILGAGLSNCLIVVTRYFGGTLLGTGGLVRAYTSAAKAALENAETAEMKLCDVLELTFDYSLHDRIFHYLETKEILPENPAYLDRVSIEVKVEAEKSRGVAEELLSLTAGRVEIRRKETGFFARKNK